MLRICLAMAAGALVPGMSVIIFHVHVLLLASIDVRFCIWIHIQGLLRWIRMQSSKTRICIKIKLKSGCFGFMLIRVWDVWIYWIRIWDAHHCNVPGPSNLNLQLGFCNSSRCNYCSLNYYTRASEAGSPTNRSGSDKTQGQGSFSPSTGGPDNHLDKKN